MKQPLLVLCVAFAGLLTGTLSFAVSAQEPVRFLAFGDTPYNGEERAFLFGFQDAHPALEQRIDFAVFYGDLKSQGVPCSPARYEAHSAAIFSVTNRPLFATLGDNDWTDCDIHGADELQKLDEIRGHVFAAERRPEQDAALAAEWQIVRHDMLPELARWRVGGIQFASFHMVGTEDGRADILNTNRAAALDLVKARAAANLAWLEAAAMAAKDARALVLVLHADMRTDTRHFGARGCITNRHTGCDPFAAFRGALVAAVRSFNRPVLLIHGSSAPFCLERGYLAQANLTRLNGPGDGVFDFAIIAAGSETDGFFAVEQVSDGSVVPACSQ